HGDTTEVLVIGRHAGSLSTEDRMRLQELVFQHRPLTVNFSKLTGFSGPGLRKLLQFCRRIRCEGVDLQVTGITDELRHLVDSAGFAELLRSTQTDFVLCSFHELSRIDVYPTHFFNEYGLRPGSPLPFGASIVTGGVNFSVFSRHATACSLVLFRPGGEVIDEIPFPREFRVGDVFAMTVFDLDPEEFEYGFRLDGPFDPARGMRFDSSKILLDPMARCITGRNVWGQSWNSGREPINRSRLIPEDFDWEGDQPLHLPFEDLVIYETHVRGFTRSSTSGVTYPGTFAAIREKIPYLKELGINCLELLPIFQFNEREVERVNPLTNETLFNYWGYNTVGFYAPHAGFAATSAMGTQVDEFKAVVKELHRNGIEILLDVVFNHTAEGNEHGPTLSFRGIDNSTYYMLTPHGEYLNYSGCGNTFNCNHPVVRDFVLNCLRYWVAEFHIDGFRFDLASILGRAADGTPLANPPLLEALAMDPILSKTKLIAEAWDAGGLYQVGSFPSYGRWAEWNGQYRDCIRRALKGDHGQMRELAQRLLGSPDIYPTRGPTASINFVTCHDGFTLADLVSYNDRHNEANGEENRDGANDNHSWNCGVEGPTDDPSILELRRRQVRNALTLLFLSHGVPMLLMGDEIGRSQQGNNNAYCQDDPLNWMDWTLVETNRDLLHFSQGLIAFRRRHAVLRRRAHAGVLSEFGDGVEVAWHGTKIHHPDWSDHNRVLALVLSADGGDEQDVLYVALNFYWEPIEFELPPPPLRCGWRLFVNTGRASPDDLYMAEVHMPAVDGSTITLTGRSIVVLTARPIDGNG
ncbi:MAG TPA: glycogen debranching protein GlgX, partial [Planctomycetaceae bacterium]|nr:glycogen debranching protein GlgX [Planctomycetaceae bacterium]